MKWFEHFSDNYRGRSVDVLYEELGHTGIACYYLLLELCTEKLESNLDQTLTNPELSFGFARRFVQRNLRVGSAKLESFLNIGQGLGLFSFEINEKELKIKMPILLELLHSDLKKTSSRRVGDKLQTGLDKEREEKEIRIDKKRIDKNIISKTAETPVLAIAQNTSNKKKELTSQEKDLNKRIWIAYQDAYKLRHKVDPIRNATINGQISMLRARLGEEAVDVIKFYLSSNNSFYVGKFHPVGLCLNDAESLRTQMIKGVAVTSTMIRDYEKQIHSKERDDQIENMWKDESDVK